MAKDGNPDAALTSETRALVMGPRPDRFLVPEFCTMSALMVVVIGAELLAIVVTLLGSNPGWARFGVVSLFVQWSALGTAGLLCFSRAWLESLHPVAGGLTAWAMIVAVVTSFAVIGELAISGNIALVVREMLDMPPPLEVREPALASIGHVSLASMVVAGMLLRYMYVQQSLRHREQSELRLRLQALQSRIRPHFLFNSMNIIASLIETEPETAQEVVEDLSELFRASLDEAGNQVSLQEELDLCDRYVGIEQLRLGERLQVRWHSPDIPHTVQIPLLTLQPLLENAIYHGIQPLAEGGVIEVRIELGPDRVEITMTNPVPPPGAVTQRHARGNNMALANIRGRLAVLFGSAAQLESREEDARFITRLSYPRLDTVSESGAQSDA